jgi:hypothetical protein
VNLGPPSVSGYNTEKPAYKAPSARTASDIYEDLRYRRRYRIARRMAFVSQLPPDPVVFSMPKVPKPYPMDSAWSGPSINYNDSIVSDVNPTIFPNPAFTPWNWPPALGQMYGEALLVTLQTTPSIFSLRCDVRLNRDTNQVSDRFLTKQLVVPQSAPQEVEALGTYTYSITLPPPVITAELTSITISISAKDGTPINGLYAHNASLTITPAVTSPELIGYGISSGESANTTLPRLGY